jgi:hypothetical protein
MKKFVTTLAVCACVTAAGIAQQRPGTRRNASKPAVRGVPAPKPAPREADFGTITGRTYTNKVYRFSVTFPDTWLIPGDDFEQYMKGQGFDLSLKAPETVDPQTKARLNRSLQHVKVLVTAFRSMPGSADNAIMRISVEDLKTVPQVKDAVDYFDLMRLTFKTIKLPADFKYSETQAEKLGAKQFAFLDVTSGAGKKRMYATVRDGAAILFTLTYKNDDDLQTMRQVLSEGDFALG